MIIRSKAPLRLGLAGGGTDVSPYSDEYGGAILNATIGHYAYATIEPTDDGKISFNAMDGNNTSEHESQPELPLDDNLILHKGVYNRIIREYGIEPLSFKMSTYVDAPPGSGLGSSSTLVVAMTGAFSEWLNIPLGEYDLAHMAFEIERIDLKMAGGKQDQYAATFGGFNFMEFYEKGKVIVNPLRIKRTYLNEMESCFLIYYTETSRLSSDIIEQQRANVKSGKESSIEAMHRLKEQATMMKEVILKGNLDAIGEILDFGWKHKKQMAHGITNPILDEIYETAIKAGSSGGKISGAGGGGFMMFYCPGNSKYNVINSLKKYGGSAKHFKFTSDGLTSWVI